MAAISYPGLCIEKTRAGNPWIRVRVEGAPKRKITISVALDHPKFDDHYHAARAGIKLQAEPETDWPDAEPGSLQEMINWHCKRLQQRGKDGLLAPTTVRERTSNLRQLGESHGDYTAAMPPSAVHRLMRDMEGQPGKAKNMLTAIRMMFDDAVNEGKAVTNPAIGIKRPKPNKPRSERGAKPWKVEDLRQYREAHPPGTMAHLALTLFMFTACRISDARLLGRAHEFERNGQTWLGWQPTKKGSSFVEIPLLPPLLKATRAVKVIGPTYILTQHGKPHASAKAMGNKFQKWCEQAGLEGLSSHGIRKAVGNLLADEGCSQYQIMAVHGHEDASTSEVYTREAQRRKLASEAYEKLTSMEW